MYHQTGIVKRKATYYFRRRVPLDLVDHYGKPEICFSLRTKCFREASRLARRHSVQLDDEFEARRLGVEVPAAPFRPSDVTTLPNAVPTTLDGVSLPTGMPDAPVEALPRPGEPLTRLYKAWCTAVPERNPKTVEAFGITVKQFVRYCAKPITELRRKDFIGFRDHLLHERGDAPKSVEKKLSYLRAVLQVAVDSEKLLVNPATRIPVPKPKSAASSRLPYGLDDLKVIFGSAIYREGLRPRAGGAEAAYWLPLLALYTGARLEELAQLHLADIRHENGVDYLDITDIGEEGSDKHLKTLSSRRRLPIHGELKAAGFLYYVKAQRKQGEQRLFPALKPDKYGKYGASWSKWWGRWCRKTLGITDKRKVFHSFRHAFRDACREAEFSEELADALMGHSGQSMGRRYGSSYSLTKLAEAMSRIEYSGFSAPT